MGALFATAKLMMSDLMVSVYNLGNAAKDLVILSQLVTNKELAPKLFENFLEKILPDLG